MSGQRWTAEHPRPHGRTRYVLGGYAGDQPCRCDVCRQGARTYEAERKKRTVPAYVGADPAREHIEYLSTQGVGLKQIAKVSGVAHGALWKIVYGVPSIGRGPSKRIRKTTLDAILAVTPRDGADGSRVPAGATIADVRTLLGRGWTKRAIAQAIGRGDENGLQVLGHETVTRRNARAIRALLDQPVPETVGKAWSVRYQAEAVPEEAPDPEHYSRDRVTLRLVELLEARIDENGWRKRAACIGKPPWMFFPARGDWRGLDAAKAVCATCPVQAECLAANLDQRDGVFGGLSAHERRDMWVSA